MLDAVKEMKRKVDEDGKSFTLRASLKWDDDHLEETSGPELSLQLKIEKSEEISVSVDAVISQFPSDLNDYLNPKSK